MIGPSGRVSEVMTGKRPLTPQMIRKLHRGLGIPLRSLLLGETPRQTLRQTRQRKASYGERARDDAQTTITFAFLFASIRSTHGGRVTPSFKTRIMQPAVHVDAVCYRQMSGRMASRRTPRCVTA